MPTSLWLPRRLDKAFSRLAMPEYAKALLMMNSPEYAVWSDHFLGSPTGTWPANTNWSYPATVGTGTEVIGITNAIGGTMTLTTGANANDSAGQAVGLNWSGDRGFYFLARVQLDTIANSKIEVGMVAALTGDTGSVNVKATPSFQATIGANCAVFCRDTTEDTALSFLSNGGTTDANADWSGTFAAATWYWLEVVGHGPTDTTGDNVTGYVNGTRVGSGNIDGSAALSPFFYVQTLTTATRTLTVDYGGCIGRIQADS